MSSLLDKIKDNSKQSEGKLIFTGISSVVIEAINPSLDELKALGINAQQDPVYASEKEGNAALRLDLMLRNPVAEYITSEGVKKGVLATKATYWLEDAVVYNKDKTKTKFINSYGQTTWGADKNSVPDWFDKEGIRECHKGEEELITLLYKWLGLTQSFKDKKGDICTLETPWSKLCAGNVSELKTLAKAAAEKGNGIKFLFGAREGDKDGKTVYYQDVYTKYPMKPGQFSFDKLVEQLNDEYGQFKAHYNSDLKLRVFVPGQIEPDMEKAFAAEAPTSSTPANGDLPF